MKNIALISLGCAKNLVDSEVMLGRLDEAGYVILTDLDKADVIIVNTCGFIQSARREALEALNDAIRIKKSGKNKKVIAAGCYVERNRRELSNKFPEIDFWIGVNDFDKIVAVLEENPYDSSPNCFLYDHLTPRILSTPASWTYVKISEGCSHKCSFCAIPQIKGVYHSRQIQSIVKEVKAMCSSGVQEINLVSQDSTYFGHDLGLKDGLTKLLEDLLKVKEIEWIRILYGYPEEISDSLLNIMQEKKICSYLDIPFQHSAPSLINKMKRGMDGKTALRLIHKIRSQLPDVALRTSLITGFPGEGENEFENLLDFVESARFEHLGVFAYSQEIGTDCFSLGDPVKERVKQKRKEEIMQRQADISYRNNLRLLGKSTEVLIEGHLKEEPGILLGRTQGQAPEVDGVVYIEEEKTRAEIISSIQKVEITGSDVYDLYAKIIK